MFTFPYGAGVKIYSFIQCIDEDNMGVVAKICKEIDGMCINANICGRVFVPQII
jgi:hypothetical protein